MCPARAASAKGVNPPPCIQTSSQAWNCHAIWKQRSCVMGGMQWSLRKSIKLWKQDKISWPQTHFGFGVGSCRQKVLKNILKALRIQSFWKSASSKGRQWWSSSMHTGNPGMNIYKWTVGSSWWQPFDSKSCLEKKRWKILKDWTHFWNHSLYLRRGPAALQNEGVDSRFRSRQHQPLTGPAKGIFKEFDGIWTSCYKACRRKCETREDGWQPLCWRLQWGKWTCDSRLQPQPVRIGIVREEQLHQLQMALLDLGRPSRED